jgi:hypothetical protein
MSTSSVPGGGLSPDGSRWIACMLGFFLPVHVLSRLFRCLFLEGLAALHKAGRLAFLGDLAPSLTSAPSTPPLERTQRATGQPNIDPPNVLERTTGDSRPFSPKILRET